MLALVRSIASFGVARVLTTAQTPIPDRGGSRDDNLCALMAVVDAAVLGVGCLAAVVAIRRAASR
jgi:hypothetical protein